MTYRQRSVISENSAYMFDKNCSKAGSIFPIPDVRGGNDTRHCDSTIILLTSRTSTISPEATGCKRQNICVPVPD